MIEGSSDRLIALLCGRFMTLTLQPCRIQGGPPALFDKCVSCMERGEHKTGYDDGEHGEPLLPHRVDFRPAPGQQRRQRGGAAPLSARIRPGNPLHRRSLPFFPEFRGREVRHRAASRITFQDNFDNVAFSSPSFSVTSPQECGWTVFGASAVFRAAVSECSSTRCSTIR